MSYPNGLRFTMSAAGCADGGDAVRDAEDGEYVPVAARDAGCVCVVQGAVVMQYPSPSTVPPPPPPGIYYMTAASTDKGRHR